MDSKKKETKLNYVAPELTKVDYVVELGYAVSGKEVSAVEDLEDGSATEYIFP